MRDRREGKGEGKGEGRGERGRTYVICGNSIGED